MYLCYYFQQEDFFIIRGVFRGGFISHSCLSKILSDSGLPKFGVQTVTAATAAQSLGGRMLKSTKFEINHLAVTLYNIDVWNSV
jgi:hypothetical protein